MKGIFRLFNNLAAMDFLFPNIKEALLRRKIRNDDELIAEVEMHFAEQQYVYDVLRMLLKRCDT